MLPFDRDAILAAVDLLALATELLGQPHINSHSAPTWPCPLRDHVPSPRRPVINIFWASNAQQRWRCQSCGTGGTAIDLVMKAHRLSFRDALHQLSERTSQGAPASRYDLDATPAQPDEDGASPAPPEADAQRRYERGTLHGWATHAADLLWQPYGEPVRKWLTRTRRIPEDVLRANRIGATGITPDRTVPTTPMASTSNVPAAPALPTRRSVSGRRSAMPAAVLPVRSKERVIYAQLRLLHPDEGQSPYLHPPHTTARNPRLGLYRPPKRLHDEIIVTEGIIDALTANAAGYRAAAVLSPGAADEEVAVYLSRLQGPLVLALDPDDPGEAASSRLLQHLNARGRRPTLLTSLQTDLNETAVAVNDWPRKLTAHVRHAIATSPQDLAPSL